MCPQIVYKNINNTRLNVCPPHFKREGLSQEHIRYKVDLLLYTVWGSWVR